MYTSERRQQEKYMKLNNEKSDKSLLSFFMMQLMMHNFYRISCIIFLMKEQMKIKDNTNTSLLIIAKINLQTHR
jgi:hypothetical protein